MLTGVISAAELAARGVGRKELQARLDAGTLQRVAHGWYATASALRPVVHAVQQRGRIGCLTGCALHGLWTPEHGPPHVIVGRGHGKVEEHWHRHHGPLPASPVFDLHQCLEQVVRHHDPESVLMVLESAIDRQLISMASAEALTATASLRKQSTLQFLDAGAGSGTETRVRLFLQRRQFHVRTQVWIPGVGRVDMIVGRSLILECDSRAHHSDPEEDRRRDLAARLLGYDTLRLSYRQVFREWEETKLTLREVLSTGAHLRPPQPRST